MTPVVAAVLCEMDARKLLPLADNDPFRLTTAAALITAVLDNLDREAMAKALCRRAGSFPWDKLSTSVRDKYMHDIDAALAAVRPAATQAKENRR